PAHVAVLERGARLGRRGGHVHPSTINLITIERRSRSSGRLPLRAKATAPKIANSRNSCSSPSTRIGEPNHVNLVGLFNHTIVPCCVGQSERLARKTRAFLGESGT